MAKKVWGVNLKHQVRLNYLHVIIVNLLELLHDNSKAINKNHRFIDDSNYIVNLPRC